jgi:O-antigen ligase
MIGTGVLLSLLVGLAAAAAPVPALGAVALAVAVAGAKRATGLASWQTLTLVALSGYLVLNYGFANLTVARLPVGHLLMAAALFLALPAAGSRLRTVLADPALVLILALNALAALHLVWDISRHGAYAARDASFIAEGVFLLLGLLWGSDEGRRRVMLKWLFYVLLANLLYSFTIPWADVIKARAPVSGLFQQVPVAGFYTHSYLYLMLGALFCLGPARYVVAWPRWVLLALAALNLFGLTLHQARSAYLSIVAAVLLLAAWGEARQALSLAALILAAVLLLAVLTAMNVAVQGRLAPADTTFLREHVESLLLTPGTPGVGTLEDRANWYDQAWREIRASTLRILWGVGFGEPLIQFATPELVAVRQPHNTHLTVWARLGLVGLAVWLALHLSILWRLAPGLRQSRPVSPEWRQTFLWCCFLYLFSVLDTTVQPHLEFSQGAIPFYVLLGFTLGLRRPPARDPA